MTCIITNCNLSSYELTFCPNHNQEFETYVRECCLMLKRVSQGNIIKWLINQLKLEIDQLPSDLPMKQYVIEDLYNLSIIGSCRARTLYEALVIIYQNSHNTDFLTMIKYDLEDEDVQIEFIEDVIFGLCDPDFSFENDDQSQRFDAYKMIVENIILSIPHFYVNYKFIYGEQYKIKEVDELPLRRKIKVKRRHASTH